MAAPADAAGSVDAALTKNGLVRGYIDGCFDIMHSGHYNAIRQAKGICDTLVVGVHSDAEIEENKALPVFKEQERYALLDHIKWIDEILYDVPYSPQIATLERGRADFCVHGDDMPVNSAGVCAYDEMRQAGRLRIIKRTEGVSTTDLIGRLLTLARDHHHPSKQTSAVLGSRMASEEAIHRFALPARQGEDDPLTVAGELAAKYNISAEDLGRLRSSIQVDMQRLSGPVQSAEGALQGDTAEEQFRVKAPVKLLASTRRIAEFASSRLPAEIDRVVYVSGSFDMFHVGHAEFLKDARALGTFLLVGIHEDTVVSRSKGLGFPVMNLTERVLNVCACKWVDEVIIGAPLCVTEDIIKTWGIHMVVRGVGHQRSTLHGRSGSLDDASLYAVPKRLNIYSEVTSKWPQLCHDTIVQRIMSNRQVYLDRNKDRAKREDKYYDSKSQSSSPKEV